MILEKKIKMKDVKKIFLNNLDDTKNIAVEISKIIKEKFFICLSGDVGSGKTTFANYLINALSNKKINVLSPTFPIVQYYKLNNLKIWHYDLYRIKESHEIFSLDFDVALNEIIIMEWPEKIKKFLPEDRLELSFSEDKNFNRFLLIKTFGNIEFNI